MQENRLGFLFGVLAAVMLFLDVLLTIILGVSDIVVRGFHAATFVGALTHGILDIVFGLLFLVFAAVGGRPPWNYQQGRPQSDHSLAAGVILIVLAIGTWYILGLGLLSALAGIFGLIGGILLVLYRH